jgi:hypothetical protein
VQRFRETLTSLATGQEAPSTAEQVLHSSTPWARRLHEVATKVAALREEWRKRQASGSTASIAELLTPPDREDKPLPNGGAFQDTLDPIVPEAGSEAGDTSEGYSNLHTYPSDPGNGLPPGEPSSVEETPTSSSEATRDESAQSELAQEHSKFHAAIVIDPATLNYAQLAKVPFVRAKMSPREHFRWAYRLKEMETFYKTYQHVMDALEDVCEGHLPQKTAASCKQLYGRAQQITDWMLHGYQEDEICIMTYMCQQSYFGPD